MSPLNKLIDQVDAIRTEDIPAIRVEIATLKTQARFWGAIGGIVSAAIAGGMFRLLVG